MYLEMGSFNTLEVLRETDISFILGDETQEIFLHKKQATRELVAGERVEVFLYFDNQKRITATMKKPLIGLDQPGFVEVVDVNPRLGVFLNVGLIKDLLLSRDDLSFVKKEWPQKGDMIFCRMRASRNQLSAKLILRYDIPKYLKPTKDLVVGERYDAYNVYKTEEGQVFITPEGHYIYVYFKHIRKSYRLGEKANIKITIDKGRFSYNGSLIEQKEIMISDDAAYLLMYMKSNRGEMPYTDKSDATDITERFHMSKGAFKRALGQLYKNKKVILGTDKTMLAEEVVEPVVATEVHETAVVEDKKETTLSKDID